MYLILLLLIQRYVVQSSFINVFFSDFDIWRHSLEDKNKFRFVKINPKSSKSLYYYHCHCSGLARRRSEGLRMRWKPSIKINKTCPVRLIVKLHGGLIHVKYCKTHVGHKPSVKDVPLRKDERAAVATKIAAGVNYNRILEDIRDDVSSDALQRIHLLDKRDIYNITKEFKLEKKFSSDDYLSTQLLVSEQMRLGESSPIIYFKNQGVDDSHGRLRRQDFLLVIMTKYQEEVISEYANDRVLIDSTHGMAGHDFQLTTIVTVDEYGAGCPVAMCLSNRIDVVAMTVFFQSVKKRVGKLPSTVFMSDDAPSYFNAWCSVMGEPTHQLLCSWHVDRSWKGKLQLIKNKQKRAEVYKGCRTLLELGNTNSFYQYLPNFLKLLNEDPDCRSFGNYFRRYYAERPEKWAYSFRRGLGLNTNMYLEALHKNLKYCYLDGKQNRRVDKCISLILRFSRNMMFERLVRAAKNKPSHRMTRISSSHRLSALIAPDSIVQTSDSTWSIKSSFRKGILYQVALWDQTSCDVSFCPLSCPECKLCLHQASCTCDDYAIRGNMCKHIHALPSDVKTLRACDNPTPLAVEEQLGLIQKLPALDALERKDYMSEIVHTINAAMGYSSKISADNSELSVPLKIAQSFFESMKKVASKENNDNIPVASHSNITRQSRFHSTKKRRVTTKTLLSKPSEAEKFELLRSFADGGEVLHIHQSPDHKY